MEQDGGLLKPGSYGDGRNAPDMTIISLCVFPAVTTRVKVLLLKKTVKSTVWTAAVLLTIQITSSQRLFIMNAGVESF